MTELIQQVRETIVAAAASDMAAAVRATLCRDELEKVVRALWLAAGETPSRDATLLELLGGRAVAKAVADAEVLESLHFIRKLGANARHGLRVKKSQEKLARDHLLWFLDFLDAVFPEGPAVPEMPGPPPGLVAAPPALSEAETRRQYIDLYLQEAGWDVSEHFGIALPSKACIEIHVDGLPTTPNGEGRCDYVLFGRDGKRERE